MDQRNINGDEPLCDSAMADLLSPREREVLELSLAGLTSARVAEKLGIAASTVRSTLHRAYGKLGVSGIEELRANMHHDAAVGVGRQGGGQQERKAFSEETSSTSSVDVVAALALLSAFLLPFSCMFADSDSRGVNISLVAGLSMGIFLQGLVVLLRRRVGLLSTRIAEMANGRALSLVGDFVLAAAMLCICMRVRLGELSVVHGIASFVLGAGSYAVVCCCAMSSALLSLDSHSSYPFAGQLRFATLISVMSGAFLLACRVFGLESLLVVALCVALFVAHVLMSHNPVVFDDADENLKAWEGVESPRSWMFLSLIGLMCQGGFALASRAELSFFGEELPLFVLILIVVDLAAKQRDVRQMDGSSVDNPVCGAPGDDKAFRIVALAAVCLLLICGCVLSCGEIVLLLMTLPLLLVLCQRVGVRVVAFDAKHFMLCFSLFIGSYGAMRVLQSRLTLLKAGMGFVSISFEVALVAVAILVFVVSSFGGVCSVVAARLWRESRCVDELIKRHPATSESQQRLEAYLVLNGLTHTEVQVVECLLNGGKAKQIAADLGYSEGSIKLFRRRAYRKLGVRNSPELYELLSQVSAV